MKRPVRRFGHSIMFLASLSFAFVACHKESELIRVNGEEYEYVTVGIDVCAGKHTPMTTDASQGTRTTVGEEDDIICETATPEYDITVTRTAQGIDDPAVTANTKIMNLWVLQYDGVADSSRLIGTPAYIENYSDPNYRNVKLVASTTPNTIVFLANTFDRTLPFQQNSTLKELKERRFTTSSLGTILAKDPATADVGTGTFPNDGDYYQRLSGHLEQIIQGGTNLSCALGHNLCRISLNIINNTSGKTYPVTLTSADIENVPGCVYFYTDYSGYTSGTSTGKPTSRDFSLYQKNNFKNVIIWTASEGTSSAVKSSRLYLPANESGVININTNPKLKSLIAPERATRLRINGTYRDGTDDISINYTFALGEDMINNYQLVPNGDYVYNITLNARGDKTSDPRVKYNPSVGIDYSQTNEWPLSNCYICNPPSEETATATYKIPVSRVDQFWGGGNYENVEGNCLGVVNTWRVSVIWSEMELDTNTFFVKNTGIGSKISGNPNYFEVSIPGDIERGNVVIGIKRTGDGAPDEWLWSWHLWITDYCPDDARYLTQQGAFIDGTDTYQVSGGCVQRYQKAAAGIVQKVYMDRSLGAIDPAISSSQKGALYYQFGRKDPFPGNAPYWEGGVTEMNDGFVVKSGKVIKNWISYDNTGANKKNVPYSVKNPTTFISGTYWTYNDKYNPANNKCNFPWYDPSYSENGGKSIFDPSPSGWKVPDNVNGTKSYSINGTTAIVSTAIRPGEGTVNYYGAGQRNGTMSYENGGQYWYSTPVSAYQAGCLFFDPTQPWAFNYNNYGFWNIYYAKSIRPIQE